MKRLGIGFVILNLAIGILVYCNTITGLDEVSSPNDPIETVSDLPQTWYALAEDKTFTSANWDTFTTLETDIDTTTAIVTLQLFKVDLPETGGCSGCAESIRIYMDSEIVFESDGGDRIYGDDVCKTRTIIVNNITPGIHTWTVEMRGSLLADPVYTEFNTSSNGTNFLMIQELVTN